MAERTIIRAALASDAEALSAFARRVFDEVFGPPNDPADMATYLSEAFSLEIQRREIAAPGSIILLAEEGSALVGYLFIGLAETPACVTGAAPVELKRIYVDPARHSRGLGQRLLDEGLARAKAAGARTVWLGVWEKNFGAQRFYARSGFERVGDHPFVLGSDIQTDWIMQRSLA